MAELPAPSGLLAPNQRGVTLQKGEGPETDPKPQRAASVFILPGEAAEAQCNADWKGLFLISELKQTSDFPYYSENFLWE